MGSRALSAKPREEGKTIGRYKTRRLMKDYPRFIDRTPLHATCRIIRLWQRTLRFVTPWNSKLFRVLTPRLECLLLAI